LLPKIALNGTGKDVTRGALEAVTGKTVVDSDQPDGRSVPGGLDSATVVERRGIVDPK
jgi:hypothetical protein